jgi:hypothetical protein
MDNNSLAEQINSQTEQINSDTIIQTEQINSDTNNKSKANNKSNKHNRCNKCNKKVGLLGFDCRCGGIYCGKHRHSNEHNCTFDFKSMELQRLKKSNPKIIADKIKKI